MPVRRGAVRSLVGEASLEFILVSMYHVNIERLLAGLANPHNRKSGGPRAAGLVCTRGSGRLSYSVTFLRHYSAAPVWDGTSARATSLEATA